MTPTDKLRDKAREWVAGNIGDEDALLLTGRAYNLWLLLADVRREALEEAARYVSTHYPVHITGRSGSRWECQLCGPDEAGKIQSVYAAAVRALKEQADER